MNWGHHVGTVFFSFCAATAAAENGSGSGVLQIDFGRYAGRTEAAGWHNIALNTTEGGDPASPVELYLNEAYSTGRKQSSVEFPDSSLGEAGKNPVLVVSRTRGTKCGTPGLEDSVYRKHNTDIPQENLAGTAVSSWPAEAARDSVYVTNGTVTLTFSHLKAGTYTLELFAGRSATNGAGDVAFSIQSPESFSTSGNCLVSAAENERGLYLKRTFSLPAGQNLVVTVRGGGSAAGALNGLILSEGGEEDSSSFITIAGNETSPVLLETCRTSGTGMHGTNAECSLQVRLPAYEKVTWFAAEQGRFPADANRELPWNAASLTDVPGVRNPAAGGTAANRGMLALFKLANGKYLAVVPLCGNASLSWLEISGHSLYAKSGTWGDSVSRVPDDQEPMLCYAVSNDIYTATKQAWEAAMAHPRLQGKSLWRYEKDASYPEPFKYLGWCSWEQYKGNINSGLLENAARTINAGSLPVRWMLVDDGFQTQQGYRLKSFSPDASKFPRGWSPLMAQRNLQKDRISWLGLWHSFCGEKQGIHAENTLGMNDKLLSINGVYYPGGSEQGADAFYEAFMKSVSDAGFNFVKIDYQTSYLGLTKGTGNAAERMGWCLRALEKAVTNNSSLLGMINCMAHGTLNVFNTGRSAVTRCSIDYSLGNLNAARSHLFQSYTNSLWLGQTAWPDHDMFHSSDGACGSVMALSKALSGAPVYLSDAPDSFDSANILPLVQRDGRLLRPLAPAVPLPDSCFIHPLTSVSLYGVIAPLNNHCAAVVYYNLNTDSTTRTGVLRPDDYPNAAAMLQGTDAGKNWEVPAEGLVAYDWRNKRGVKLTARGVALSLPSAEGGTMQDVFYLLAPVKNGWAVLGNPEKFLSPACVREGISSSATEMEFTLEDAEQVLIYQEEGTPVIEGSVSITPVPGSAGFFLVRFPESADRNRVVRVRREVKPEPAGYEKWKKDHFEGTDADSAPDGNPAGDGIVNLMKYATGRDPLKPCGSVTTLTVKELGGKKYMALAWPVNPDAKDVAFAVESSGNLEEWVEESGARVSGSRGEYVDGVEIGGTGPERRFLRLKVTRL